ncbi:MAG: hypothetical protein QOE82_2485 [Thermoanaerobaculia bacterium]|jgi:hypothetical protein|nr:hypothetical protein [Thermoanaerobaculia bacterium]
MTTSSIPPSDDASREKIPIVAPPFAREAIPAVAPPSLRTIDGFVGVFTPLGTHGSESPETNKNLEQIIDRLTTELVAARQTNLELQHRIDQILAPAKSPDDLATALRTTVDGLQNELSSLSNPISNFAVKDFRLETSVAVGITPLGKIEYRLIQPGANVDPSAVSKLTLSLVPVEKRLAAGSMPPGLFEPNKDLSVLGMGDPLRQVLEENHIFTIGDFRSTAMRAQVRTSLVALQVTSQQEIALLQARAELMLLTGIDRTIADTLIAAHIDSLALLARAKPEGLKLILKDVDSTLFAQWIAAAQTFTGTDTAVQPRHVVSIATQPPNLLVRLDPEAAFVPETIVRQLPAGPPVKIRTINPQLTESGTGYALAKWSTGATTSATTIQSSNDVAATAGFQLACHAVTAATVTPGGKVVLSPATGGIPGFPANCYAPGSKVQAVVTVDTGFALKSVTIISGGTTRTVTSLRTSLALDGPITALVAFVPKPSTASSIFPPEQAENGVRSRVFFTNQTPRAGFDVRVTAMIFETTAGSGVISLLSALPLVFGDLPPNGKTQEQQLAYDLPPDVTTFNIFLTVEMKNAVGDTFTERHSVGHGRPGAGF